MTKYLDFLFRRPVCGSLLFNRTTLCPQGAWDHAAVNLWNTRLHRSSSLTSQQSWPCSCDREPGRLQERMYRSHVHDVDHLRSHLIEEWKHFHQVFIDGAIRQWHPRLWACIRAHGGHFEHRL